ncbi:MAG: hypothetical protein KAJ29_01670 [Alphaproteobacteria bacterium]|nr:hypothetical protein [Alphaproteobacteria bacterium]
MTDEPVAESDNKPKTGTLVDFVYGVDENSKLQIDVAVREDGKCAVFYNKPFKSDISWLEFDLGTCMLDFVLDGGEMRDSGLPVTRTMSKNMQNTHQMLMVLIDDKTGEPKEGQYIPLIIHRT